MKSLRQLSPIGFMSGSFKTFNNALLLFNFQGRIALTYNRIPFVTHSGQLLLELYTYLL